MWVCVCLSFSLSLSLSVSLIIPSTFLLAFAPVSVSVPPSPQTTPPRYTKMFRCFSLLPFNLDICSAAHFKAPLSSPDLVSVHVYTILPTTLSTVLGGLPHCPLILPTHLRIATCGECPSYSFFVFLLITSTSTTVVLRALPCLRPTSTMNSSNIPGPHTTLPFVSSYVLSIILTSASGPPIHLNVAITIFLGTVSYSPVLPVSFLPVVSELTSRPPCRVLIPFHTSTSSLSFHP